MVLVVFLSFFSFFLLVCLLYAPQTCFHALFFALCASASASALRGRRIYVFGGSFVTSLSRGVSSRRGFILMFDATRLLRFVAGVGAGVPRACVLCAVLLGLIVVQPCGTVVRLCVMPSIWVGCRPSGGGEQCGVRIHAAARGVMSFPHLIRYGTPWVRILR